MRISKDILIAIWNCFKWQKKSLSCIYWIGLDLDWLNDFNSQRFFSSLLYQYGRELSIHIWLKDTFVFGHIYSIYIFGKVSFRYICVWVCVRFSCRQFFKGHHYAPFYVTVGWTIYLFRSTLLKTVQKPRNGKKKLFKVILFFLPVLLVDSVTKWLV